jgi:hypothetical protein
MFAWATGRRCTDHGCRASPHAWLVALVQLALRSFLSCIVDWVVV